VQSVRPFKKCGHWSKQVPQPLNVRCLDFFNLDARTDATRLRLGELVAGGPIGECLVEGGHVVTPLRCTARRLRAWDNW